MTTIVQVNLRAPEGDKALLADVAARLREGGGFAERLSAFLAAEGAGAAWADRLEAIERRLEALEGEHRKEAYEALHPETRRESTLKQGDKLPSRQVGETGPADRFTADTAARTGQSERVVQRDAERGEKVAEEAHTDLADPLSYPVEPAGTAVEGEEDWTAKAAAITTTTGEGKGRKLTDAGAGLFAEMLAAGVPLPSIARTVGISPQSAHTRAKKLGAGG